MNVSPASGPPFDIVAPFFVVAPLGLVAAGVLLMGTGDDALLAVNAPRLVAVTHALVLGWLTLSIMGALYQLGPAVLEGRIRWPRLMRVQFWTHVVSVAVFVPAFLAWDIRWVSAAGVGIIVSFILFLISAFPAVAAFRRGSLARAYVSVALLFLAGAGSVGITYAGTLEHAWFPVTLGRLSGHAHLGLLGWLGLVLMGVSYQVVPMFNLVKTRQPRFGWAALAITAVGAAAGSVILMGDPPMGVRVAVAGVMAVGPLLWACDMIALLNVRFRRRLDVQGRATYLSLGFLAGAIILGLLVAVGADAAPGNEPGRLQLAYGALGIGGWAGITLIGNSYKVVPFLTWYHRYRQLAGIQPVPMVGELYDPRLAHTVLAVHALGVCAVAVGALAGSVPLIHAGGVLLLGSGMLLFVSLLAITLRKPAARQAESSPRGLTSS